MATNDDDLYGDLDDAVAKPMPSTTSYTSSTSRKSLTAPPTMMSQPEIAQLQQQVKSLKVENDLLKRNIGILYRTSKSELERKDRTIDQLQNELDSTRG
ncbi:hypothetical protein ACHAXR_012362 [Thalassiosira sp. AJA248-18]